MHSDIVRIGILGTASIAEAVVRAADDSDRVRIVAVASRDADRAESFARTHGIPRWFSDYDALLNSGAVDAVYLPLPNSLHARWTLRCLDAGLPVLCEKPLCASPQDAALVARRSRAEGLPVLEGFMYRFHPQYELLARLLGEGAVGSLRAIHSRFSWWCDDPAGSVAASATLDGGALFDVGCYCVHLSRIVAGREPARVFAFERRPDPHGVDEGMHGLLHFGADLTASFETGIDRFERHGAELVGELGMIELERPWTQHGAPTRVRLLREGRGAEEFVLPPFDTYREELERFAAMIRNGADWRPDLDDSVSNAAVMDALFRSAREGRAVEPEPPASDASPVARI